MTAASTSSSPKSPMRCLLRLADVDRGSRCDFALYKTLSSSSTFDFASEGVVHESYFYKASLLSESKLDLDSLRLTVNGEDSWTFEALGQGAAEGDFFAYQLVSRESNGAFFRRSYGFVVVEVHLEFADGHSEVLSTKDIACVCDRDNQGLIVSKLLDELVSNGNNQIMNWMLAPQQAEQKAFSLVDFEAAPDDPQSFQSFLKLCEEVLRHYETNVNFFKTCAFSKVVKRDEVIDARCARKLGRRELMWLSHNSDTLYEVKEKTPLVVQGVSYMASRVQTERSRPSYDNRENRALLAFLDEILHALSGTVDAIKVDVEKLEEAAQKLRCLDSDEGLLPALLLVDSSLEKERPLLDRALGLRKKARRLSWILKDALPRVRNIRYRLPKRTKVFQEIRPYADLYSCMRKWDTFGEHQILRDGLVLHTLYMDKLYEYYVLYRLLSELSRAGYVLDESLERPAEQVSYSLNSRYYSNEKQVANVYHLARGGEKITLYYEPVVYGGAIEEHGVGLHRTTRTEGCASSSLDSYWLPDYFIRHEKEGRVRRHILDAKFRRLCSDRGTGLDSNIRESFMQGSFKYKTSMVACDGSQVESLWFLCGRETHQEFRPHQNSTWVSENTTLVTPDGLASVAPGADALREVLVALRLVGKE